ncbi:hypothetical protein ACJJTC_006547 [Scirpophaga incertulas]
MALECGPSSIRRREIQQGVMIGACALAGVVVLANLYTWGRVLAALLLPPRARLARALRRDAPTLALRPEVQALTHMVSALLYHHHHHQSLFIVMIGACALAGVVVLANLYTWGRVLAALLLPPRARLARALRRDAPTLALRPEVQALTHMVSALLYHHHPAPHIPIDPHIISKAVEVNSRRAFSESNIGGWDYLRNMVQLPFYLQNSALRRVKAAQQSAAKRLQAAGADDFTTSLQRSVSARRLSSTSELMSSQERIKNQTGKEVASNSVQAARARRLRRLLKAFQIEFNWYQLASWVNLTEQWPFRTSWIIYHHETYEEHIDDTMSLKNIYEKVKPVMSSIREASTLMELDRDERKLEVFLSFHRATLTAADLKIFLPFTINLDPYIKKVIKEEQMQSIGEEEISPAPWGSTHPRHPHSKLFHRKHRSSPPSQSAAPLPASPQPLWVGWANGPGYLPSTPQYNPQYTSQPTPAPPQNPLNVLRTAFPALGDVSGVRLSTLSVERVCELVRAALGASCEGACAALRLHRVCGLALSACRLADLQPVRTLTRRQRGRRGRTARAAWRSPPAAWPTCSREGAAAAPRVRPGALRLPPGRPAAGAYTDTPAARAPRPHRACGLALSACRLADLQPVRTLTRRQRGRRGRTARAAWRSPPAAWPTCSREGAAAAPRVRPGALRLPPGRPAAGAYTDTPAARAPRPHRACGLALSACRLADLQPVRTLTRRQRGRRGRTARAAWRSPPAAWPTCSREGAAAAPRVRPGALRLPPGRPAAGAYTDTPAARAPRPHRACGLALSACRLADLQPVRTLTRRQRGRRGRTARAAWRSPPAAWPTCSREGAAAAPRVRPGALRLPPGRPAAGAYTDTPAARAPRPHRACGLALSACRLADLQPVRTLTRRQRGRRGRTARAAWRSPPAAWPTCSREGAAAAPRVRPGALRLPPGRPAAGAYTDTPAARAPRPHRACGLALSACRLADLQPVRTLTRRQRGRRGQHRACGLALSACRLADLQPVRTLTRRQRGRRGRTARAAWRSPPAAWPTCSRCVH